MFTKNKDYFKKIFIFQMLLQILFLLIFSISMILFYKTFANLFSIKFEMSYITFNNWLVLGMILFFESIKKVCVCFANFHF